MKHRSLLGSVLAALLVLALPLVVTPSAHAAPNPVPTWVDASVQGGEDSEAQEGAADDAAGGEEEKSLTDTAKDELKGFMDDPVGTSKRWFVEQAPIVAGRVLLFLIILAIAKIIANFCGRVVRKLLDKSARNASELFKKFVENSVVKVVFFIGLILALQNIGLDIAPLLAGVGVVGFVVGFALQDTLGNFAAGIMLLLYRPFDVGDFVNAGGQDGTVEAMTLVSTTLLTPDNQRLTIPNGSIWGGVIRNVTANDKRRTNETIGIGYEDDIPKAEKIILEVVKGLEHVMDDPAPAVVLTELGDSSVNFSVRAWVPTSEYFGTCCAIRREVKIRFDKEGISIPFPQRDVHLIKDDGA